MKRFGLLKHVGIAFCIAAFLIIVLSVQIFLSFRQRYTRAASDEVTERSQALVEQVRATLQKQHSSTEQP